MQHWHRPCNLDLSYVNSRISWYEGVNQSGTLSYYSMAFYLAPTAMYLVPLVLIAIVLQDFDYSTSSNSMCLKHQMKIL